MTEDRSFGKKSPKSKLNCRFGRFYVFFFSSWAPSQQALCRAGFSLSSVSIIGQLAGKGRGGGSGSGCPQELGEIFCNGFLNSDNYFQKILLQQYQLTASLNWKIVW